MNKLRNNISSLGVYILNNFWTFIFSFILIVQVFLIIFCNLTLIDNNIDCDNAKLFVHIMRMCEDKMIIIPDWSYVSTLEIDCSSILALPIFMLSNNIYFSYGVANIILLLSFIALIFYLFKGKNVFYPILASNMFCIPYGVGMLDYFNMMFFCGAQYIIKASLPLLLIAIILQVENKSSKRTFCSYIPIIIFELLLFVTSFSSGVYVLFVGILPILIAYIIYKIVIYQRIPLLTYIISGISILFGLLGIILNNIIIDGGKSANMTLISVYQILANVSSCFAGIFELFGGIAHEFDITVLSANGINILLKELLVYIILVCAFIACLKIIKNKADLRTILLISVSIWNLFVLLSTNTRASSSTYEYRYHLIGMLPLICVTSITLLDVWYKIRPLQKTFFATIGVVFIIAINVMSFPVVLDKEDEQAELKELCSYCDSLDLEYVYLFDASSESEMCRLITESNAEYLCLTPGGVTWVYDYYTKYVNAPIPSENAILVVDNRYDFGESFESFGYKFAKLDTIANRTIYYFSD